MPRTGPAKKKLTRLEFLSIFWGYIAANRFYDAALIMWPWIVPNPQTEMIYDELTANNETYFLGHASGSKTFSIVSHAFMKWLWKPTETTVLLCGPTLKSLEPRAWMVQKKLVHQARIPLYCDVIESKHIVRFHDYAAPADDPDRELRVDGGRIECVDGSAEGKDHRIRGVHTKNIIVFVDEGDAANLKAVWSAIPNLSASSNLEIRAATNPTDKNTPMGNSCKPIDGWGSIDIESDNAWGTESGARVIRLDALRSPNVVMKEKLYDFLPTLEWVEKIRDTHGENSPVWYSQVRAWFPPEGMINQIFSFDIIKRMFENDGRFYADTIPIAALDPAYEEGGDNCVFGWGEAGRDADNPRKTLIRLNNMTIVKRTDPAKLVTEDFGDQVISLNQANGVEGRFFGYDTTGNGLSVGDYIRAKWKRDALPVAFGGPPTSMRVLAEDSKKAEDRFDRFVTELWFAARDWARAGHVIVHPDCDFQEELRLDLESRRYVQLPREKVKAERKKDMKERGLKSPDFGDFFAILIHVVRVRIMEFMPNASGPRLVEPKSKESYWEKIRHPKRPVAYGLGTANAPKYRRSSSQK